MISVGKILIFAGFAASGIAQIIGAFYAFRISSLHGLLSFFVPGFIFFALKRAGVYRKIISIWLAGVVAILAGTILLS